jgi:hypothetical protein
MDANSHENRDDEGQHHHGKKDAKPNDEAPRELGHGDILSM